MLIQVRLPVNCLLFSLLIIVLFLNILLLFIFLLPGITTGANDIISQTLFTTLYPKITLNLNRT